MLLISTAILQVEFLLGPPWTAEQVDLHGLGMVVTGAIFLRSFKIVEANGKADSGISIGFSTKTPITLRVC